ncbi:hypothetical protein N0V84_007996 [Fusarium piperis]|uniref:Uncharacterized protein n=1 Tax=Fusarium piperis TaxID=1435070 RepID=A0A9W8W8Z0_9HYPO|nr:hypothetical protein N0V84_007996 [Fusarium piperis]
MALFIPRMHLFEIDDQPWFPPFLRVIVQAILAQTWSLNLLIPSRSPAQIATSNLIQHLDSLASLRFVDFCAGAGGPSPLIEQQVNTYLRNSNHEEVDFVLTDIHPNIDIWTRIASENPRITYDGQSVDASRVPERLVQSKDGRRLFRLFNLAFHHFDDNLA